MVQTFGGGAASPKAGYEVVAGVGPVGAEGFAEAADVQIYPWVKPRAESQTKYSQYLYRMMSCCKYFVGSTQVAMSPGTHLNLAQLGKHPKKKADTISCHTL